MNNSMILAVCVSVYAIFLYLMFKTSENDMKEDLAQEPFPQQEHPEMLGLAKQLEYDMYVHPEDEKQAKPEVEFHYTISCDTKDNRKKKKKSKKKPKSKKSAKKKPRKK
jgi:hypothetical protein